MLLTALKLKLAAMVAVAGIDTAEMPGVSKEFEAILTKLEAEQSKVAKEPGAAGTDINKAFNDAVAQVRDLVAKGDKDATYALAHWGVLSGANINEVAALYDKAATAGSTLAKAELAQVLMQAGSQNPEAVKKAIQLIKDAEAENNKTARRMLAQLHLQGVTEGEKGTVIVEKSPEKAKALLEKGSAAKDGEATLGLAQLYAAGVPGTPKDDAKALELLQLAGQQGNAVALSTYGARLLNGDPDTEGSPKLVKKNVADALKMFEESAKTLPAANRILGQIYENGVGENGADVKQDVKKAFDYYTVAARGNDPQALFRLGNAFETGIIKDPAGKRDDKDNILIQPNPKSALDLYRLAAQNNLAEAFFNVGVYYETGTVVDKDPEKAFAFHMKASNAGIPQAMNRLAGLYANGTGVTQDVVAAAGWYARAAEMRFAPAQIALGILYEQGAGVKQDRAMASSYYQDAAQQGNALAMLRLANLNAVGVTGKPDFPKAWSWAKQADDLARKTQNQADIDVTANVLKQIEDKMSAAEKTEAQRTYEKLKLPAAAAAPAAAPATAPARKGK